jgi:PBP1b-binding outer membrane lipoprotein LpoB
MKRVIVFVSILLVVTFVIAGCSGGSTKASVSTTVNAPMSSVTSSTIASTSPATTNSSNIQWPSATLVGVPVFTYGTITGYNNNVNGNVQVTIANITDAAASGKYMSDLTNAGWSIYLSNYNTAAQGTEIEASIGQNGGISGLEILFTNNGKATITYNASTPPWQWTTTSPAS